MRSSKPQPTVPHPRAHPLPKCTGPALADALLGSREPPPLGSSSPLTDRGVRVLEPWMWDQLLPLAPVPQCFRAGPLPLLSCSAPRATPHRLHPGCQQGSPSMACRRGPRVASLASACSALPPQRALAADGAGAARGSCQGCSQPVSSPRRGPGLPQCHALQVGTQAAGLRARGPSSGRLQQPHLNSQLLCGAFTCCRRKL